MLNAQGGVNGRKINFTQFDNAYSAPKAVEQSRRLVEDVVLDESAARSMAMIDQS